MINSTADSEGPSKAGTGSDSCGPQEYYISFDSPADSAGENQDGATEGCKAD